MANKYRKGNKFKSFELYTWAKTKKELMSKLPEIKKLFLKLLEDKKITLDKFNYGITKVEDNEKLLNTTKLKTQTFCVGE